MKLKEGWVLTEMDGEYVAVPTKESAEKFSGVVRLNETAKDIWQGLAEGLDEARLAEKLVSLYEVTPEQAKQAVQNVIAALTAEGLLV